VGYQQALEAAGAKVLNFWEFGSYQGDWVAQVECDGSVKWVKGGYGSCSECDAFQSEFGYLDEEKPGYQKRLAEFGKSYLSDAQPLEAILKGFYETASWDSDAKEAIETLEPFLGKQLRLRKGSAK